MRRYLAVDLGAESGRVIAGKLHESHLELEEIHRFANTPLRTEKSLFWNAPALFHEIQHGLKAASHLQVNGIGVDTWGLDFGLLTEDGRLVENPRHYRDPGNQGAMDEAFQTVSRQEIFEATGVQFMEFNSLYQLLRSNLEDTSQLLFMPDLFNFWLTGVRATEPTIASTSQFYSPVHHDWAHHLLERFGFSSDFLPEIRQTGEFLGDLQGLGFDAQVFSVASHDTASAVVSVPAEECDDWCYISSGTWSLMGVEIDQPIINRQCLDLNFTNEVGAGGKIRLLKNITGMWIIQECRRQWEAESSAFSYGDICGMAAEAPPLMAVLDVDRFHAPGYMPTRIREWCIQSGQRVPSSPGEIARVVFEGMALRYRIVKENLEQLTGKPIRKIHIVGGGSKNELLNQLTADACQATVIAGPVEATAAGNVLVQAYGNDLRTVREVVRNSFTLKRYEPRQSVDWSDAVTLARKFATPAV